MSYLEEKKNSLVSQVLRFGSSKKGLYIASVGLAIVGVLLSIIPYYMIGKIVTELWKGNNDWNYYQTLFLWMGVCWVGRVLFHNVSTSCSHVATFNVLANIRRTICKVLMDAPLGEVQNYPSGSLKNIVVERVDSIETTLAHVVPEFTANIMAPIVFFIYLLTINWKMALASLAVLPIGMIFMMGMYKDAGASMQRCMEATKALNDVAVEYINGIEVIKAFGKSKSSYEKFVDAAREGANSYIDWMRRSIVYFTGGMAIVPSTLISVLPIGAMMVRSGSLALNDYVLIIILAAGLITPLINALSYQDDIAKASVILGEVEDLLKMKPLHRPEVTKEYPKDHTIELKDVHFGYGEKEVLHGINMTIPEDQLIAFVGPSGSGKSTIAKLIASLWDVDSGSISLGGVNIKDMTLDDYYENVAFVSQDNFLFNQSVKENIRMGKKDATDEEVYEVAKKCGVHDFIMNLENGYDTIVGDAGGHLSGGERQRITIARAMLKDAPIIILDEATAYTDPENEALIQKAISQMTKGKTLIVIAHRLSTITNSDCIYVIEEGKVVGQGKHEELLQSCPLYKSMWEAHISVKDTVEEGVA